MKFCRSTNLLNLQHHQWLSTSLSSALPQRSGVSSLPLRSLGSKVVGTQTTVQFHYSPCYSCTVGLLIPLFIQYATSPPTALLAKGFLVSTSTSTMALPKACSTLTPQRTVVWSRLYHGVPLAYVAKRL
eukprot:Gb_02894 [translate_table: standard]